MTPARKPLHLKPTRGTFQNVCLVFVVMGAVVGSWSETSLFPPPYFTRSGSGRVLVMALSPDVSGGSTRGWPLGREAVMEWGSILL